MVSAHSVDDEFLVVGRFLAPQGLKGWIRVFSHTDPASRLGDYRPLWIPDKSGRGRVPLDVEDFRQQGKLLLMKVKGCDDRTQAEAFAGIEIAIKVEQRATLDEGEYYWSDLIGLQVVNLEGQAFGVVRHLLETGANDVLVVAPTPESLDQRERLIPYLPEQVLKQIDLAGRMIRVDWDADF